MGPQCDVGLSLVLAMLERIQQDFNGSRTTGTLVSLADLIILGGCAAVERAAKQGGHDVKFPFTPGRTDATAEQIDTEAFAVLEPTADRFRNDLQKGHDLAAEHLLVDTAFVLTLSAPQMTAGGPCCSTTSPGSAADARADQGRSRVDRPTRLTRCRCAERYSNTTLSQVCRARSAIA